MAESLHLTKVPQATLDYGSDWTAWLGEDTISESTWQIEPAGLIAEEESDDGKITVIWATGGTVGITYKMVNDITTVEGRRDQRAIYLTIVPP